MKSITHEPDDLRKTRISSEQISKIEQLCIGKDRLFDDSALTGANKEKLRISFRKILENYTGFQKIASLLCIATLIQGRFVVASTNGYSCSVYYPTQGTIGLNFESPIDDFTWLFLHELSHGFHDFLMQKFRENKTNYYIKVITHLVVNSRFIDLKNVMFPFLNPQSMSPIIEKIKSFIDESLIESRHDVISDLISRMVTLGFGGAIFDYGSESEGSSSSLPAFSKDAVARAIYIEAFYQQRRWDNAKEILNITGLLPVEIGDRTFIITDRNTELIFRKRADASKEDFTSEFELKQYRSHVKPSDFEDCNQVVQEMRKSIYETLGIEVPADTFKPEDFQKIIYPQSPLHLPSEHHEVTPSPVASAELSKIMLMLTAFSGLIDLPNKFEDLKSLLENFARNYPDQLQLARYYLDSRFDPHIGGALIMNLKDYFSNYTCDLSPDNLMIQDLKMIGIDISSKEEEIKKQMQSSEPNWEFLKIAEGSPLKIEQINQKEWNEGGYLEYGKRLMDEFSRPTYIPQ